MKNKLFEKMTEMAFGISLEKALHQNICVCCGKGQNLNDPKLYPTEADKATYHETGLCPICFNRLMEEG